MRAERHTIRHIIPFIVVGLALTMPLPARQTPASGPYAAAGQPPSEGVEAPLTWGDVDGDGLQDALALLPNGALRLFRNRGDGTLTDITQDVGLLELAAARSALLHDLDGDGLADLLVSGAGGSRLLACTGRGFLDITAGSGLGDLADVHAARALDYDADGVTDLLVQGNAESVLMHGLGVGIFERVALPLAGTSATSSWNGAVLPVVPGPALVGGISPDTAEASGHTLGLGGSPGGGTPGAGRSPGSTISMVGPTPTVGDPTPIQLGCVPSIQDQAGGCVTANSVPTLGSLYPIGDKFFIDGATGQIGIGTATPDTFLANGVELTGTDSNPSTAFVNTSYGINAYYIGRYANGTPSAPTAPLAGDSILYVSGQGYDGVNWTEGSRAIMIFSASEDWTPTANGTEISFETTPNGDCCGNHPERMRITNDGKIGIGTSTPSSPLTVEGTIESLSGGIKFPDGSVQNRASETWTGHINGATGAPNGFFQTAGAWTSARVGVGLYTISIPGLVPGCTTPYALPNPVVTIWNTGAVSNASAFINGVGSVCASGTWLFYVKTVINGVAADSDFTFSFENPFL